MIMIMHSKWRKMYVALGTISVTGLFALIPNVLDVGYYEDVYIIPVIFSGFVGSAFILQSLLNIMSDSGRTYNFKQLCKLCPELKHSHKAEQFAQSIGMIKGKWGLFGDIYPVELRNGRCRGF